MMHVNPYRIQDHDNIFEESENSSHPEMGDGKRLWKFQAYTFETATELQKFMESEGLDPRRYETSPVRVKDAMGAKIFINIVPKGSSAYHGKGRI